MLRKGGKEEKGMRGRKKKRGGCSLLSRLSAKRKSGKGLERREEEKGGRRTGTPRVSALLQPLVEVTARKERKWNVVGRGGGERGFTSVLVYKSRQRLTREEKKRKRRAGRKKRGKKGGEGDEE